MTVFEAQQPEEENARERVLRLVSVNVSRPREIEFQGKTILTGIFKQPVDERVMIRRLNLDGDAQADLSVHGGVDKAVYAYTLENYDYWRRELERDDLEYGQFGENLTVEGMLDDDVSIGDVFRIGTTLLEVTQPRVPCFKLAARMEMPTFPRLFLKSCRTGFYLRVIEEGEVGAGDSIALERSASDRMSVRQICELLFHDRANVEDVDRALKIEALSPGWRQSFAERIRKADAN